MGVNQLTGTPWHKERVHRADGDPRRHKTRCKFYIYREDYCFNRSGWCMGSAHCNAYVAISDQQFAERQKARAKNLAYPDNASYSSRISKPEVVRSKEEVNVSEVEKPKAVKKSIPDVKIGSKVVHKKYGEGSVIAVSHDRITVKFLNKEASFEYPRVFLLGFLEKEI